MAQDTKTPHCDFSSLCISTHKWRESWLWFLLFFSQKEHPPLDEWDILEELWEKKRPTVSHLQAGRPGARSGWKVLWNGYRGAVNVLFLVHFLFDQCHCWNMKVTLGKIFLYTLFIAGHPQQEVKHRWNEATRKEREVEPQKVLFGCKQRVMWKHVKKVVSLLLSFTYLKLREKWIVSLCLTSFERLKTWSKYSQTLLAATIIWWLHTEQLLHIHALNKYWVVLRNYTWISYQLDFTFILGILHPFTPFIWPMMEVRNKVDLK